MCPFDGSENKITFNKSHHYILAHIALKDICFSDPKMFFDIMRSSEREAIFDNVWENVCDRCALQEEPTFSVRDLKVKEIKVGEYPAIFIEMPPPQNMTEAYMICVVLKCDEKEPEQENVEALYYLLEKTISFDDSEEAKLCSWEEDDIHIQFDSISEITEEKFLSAVVDLLPAGGDNDHKLSDMNDLRDRDKDVDHDEDSDDEWERVMAELEKDDESDDEDELDERRSSEPAKRSFLNKYIKSPISNLYESMRDSFFRFVLKALEKYDRERNPDFMDEDGFFVLPEKIDFTYSSVKGDFRIHKLKDGFCVAWKEFIAARDYAGNLKWEIYGYGRDIDVSPDMSRIVAISDSSKELAILDAETGEVIGDNVEFDSFLSNVYWQQDMSGIIAHSSEDIYILNDLAHLKETIRGEDLFDDDHHFITGLALFDQNKWIVVADSNGAKLHKLDLESKKFIQEVDTFFISEIFQTEDRSKICISNDMKIQFYDQELKALQAIEVRGAQGVKFATQSKDEHSYHHWIVLPDLSPDHEKILFNDQAGRLWLIEVEDDMAITTFSRELLDYVYDVKWIDNENFIAILNQGYVCKVNAETKEIAFRENDF